MSAYDLFLFFGIQVCIPRATKVRKQTRIIYVFCSGVCGKVSESAWRPVIGDNRVEFEVVACISAVDALPV